MIKMKLDNFHYGFDFFGQRIVHKNEPSTKIIQVAKLQRCQDWYRDLILKIRARIEGVTQVCVTFLNFDIRSKYRI